MIAYDSASFRDPAGRVLVNGDRVFRELFPSGEATWRDLKTSTFFEEFIRKDWVVGTWESNANVGYNESNILLEHEKIPFISYAYEWPPSFLKEAALLHLRLCEKLLSKGFILKDATPFNIQFKGYKPILIDVLSIEKHAQGDVWGGYAQFCDTFLYPLMLYYYKGVSYHHWLRSAPQGIRSEHFAPLFGIRDLFKKGIFFHVKLRNLFHAKFQNPDSIKRSEIQEACLSTQFILNNVRSLIRIVRKLSLGKQNKSHWTKYVESNTYDAISLNEKKAFVENFIKSIKPRLVWDLGCNSGIFSQIAARYSSYVVSFDNDIDVIEQWAEECREKSLNNILPLVMDLSNPSPPSGWMCQEQKSILDREKPDLLLSLALMHHLFVRESIPLEKQLLFLAKSARYCIVEYVDVEDPMFKKLMTNISRKSDGYNKKEFEYWSKRYFKVLARQSLQKMRTLYALESVI